MKYRKLGESDLEVSEISLGSWLTYGVGVEANKARACLDAAFDVGINFIDTANIYGRGAAETFLGSALKSRPRTWSIPIASKYRGAMFENVADTRVSLPSAITSVPIIRPLSGTELVTDAAVTPGSATARATSSAI